MSTDSSTLMNGEQWAWNPARRNGDEDPVGVTESVYVKVKPYVDFALALILFLLTLPVVLVLALLVRLTSRGPAFYSQTRLGLHGRPYLIYKLRTMRHNCEKGVAVWATKGDPRVTFLGRILRKTHLDELPQLWNVLRGEMSLVGPRPERPEFVPGLAEAIPEYPGRLEVRPGVTGLAQIQLPADTDLDSVRKKLRYDLYYMRNITASLDAKIILSTALKMLHVPFWVSRATLRIPGADKVEPRDQADDESLNHATPDSRLQIDVV
jgi:lipopolysaccharide/colanic/teichoic acid biosynthesis glycosyltransferase